MKQAIFKTIAVFLMIIIPLSVTAGELVHHDLKAVINPDENSLRVTDEITVPAGVPGDQDGTYIFSIHGGLNPSSPTKGVSLSPEKGSRGDVALETYRVTFPNGLKKFELRYGGKIDHPLRQVGEEYARGQKETSGSISPEGVYLSGNSYWYPRIGEGPLTFNLEVTMPEGWDAVSQGDRTLHVIDDKGTRTGWECPEPQDAVYLAGGRYTEYTMDVQEVKAMVFLREPDEALAGKYLEGAAQYLGMYQKLIGPYPYRKFALVENFWETGYGMPSFTLLGPRIIRFPFILHSSYPHEILHNYWGNSVFIDYESGNWGEGLTAYLADHLIKEQRGDGAEHRRTTLQKYADYVLKGRDLPLTEFRSRHGSVTEAVGYGKSMMLFHMLRLELGDDVFIDCLREFYRSHKYETADFDALRKAFEKVSGKDLKSFFDQWVKRPGAPQIRVSRASITDVADGYLLRAVLEQVQPDEPFSLRVPLAVTMEGRDEAHTAYVEMNGRTLDLELHLPARPLRLDIDPEFDIFRRLNRNEIPPALSQAFGAEKALILLPSREDYEILAAYRELASFLSRTGPGEVLTVDDSGIDKLPEDSSVWIFGWENKFLPSILPTFEESGVKVGDEQVRFERNGISREDHAFVLTARHPLNPDLAVLWTAVDDISAIPGLGRKLPHYHKYSYLAFEGDEPANVAKGIWPVTGSPMTVLLPAEDGTSVGAAMGKLPARTALASLPPIFSGERMMETIRYLAGPGMKGLGFGSPGLDEAAGFIAKAFSRAGLEPAGDEEGIWFQTWTAKGGDPETVAVMKNVVGVIPGTDRNLAGESVVVGAHYDHLGLGWPDARAGNRGMVHPGADDNSSGVAVLVELAAVLGKSLQPARTVVFAAFTGEEAGKLGSKYYLNHQKRHPPEKMIGMVNLDTVGRLEKKKLMILGGESAREWVHIFRGAGFVTGVETEMVGEALDAGDQISFHAAGVPAVQLFTGPHLDYHRPSDTPDKIDAGGLVKVAAVVREVIEYLAGSEASLTSALEESARPGDAAGEKSPSGGRKVSLGTVPDFSYSGDGVRLSGVAPGSPAEASGLREGDVIIMINDTSVGGLRDFSSILKLLSPGDRVKVTFTRGGEVMNLETSTAAR